VLQKLVGGTMGGEVVEEVFERKVVCMRRGTRLRELVAEGGGVGGDGAFRRLRRKPKSAEVVRRGLDREGIGVM
jgi:hypothetical protein